MLLEILLGLSLLVIALLLWLFLRQRRRLGRYAAAVRRAADEGLAVIELPEDVSGLERLSNAVKALTLLQQDDLGRLDAERARLSAVLDRMTDGVLIADASGRIQFANPAAGQLFGTPQPVGKTVAEVVRQYQLVEAWQRCRETGEAQEESLELAPQRLFLRLVVLPDRQTGSSLLLVQDLTRLRRLETVRRDFISNLSHELRTPLASLKALTETLRDGALQDPPAADRFLTRIETEVDALSQMVGELLELSRIESGQVPLELKPVDPGWLLRSACERMRAQAERAGLELIVEAANGLPKVQADRSRLEQVLVNLIHNALKFTRPGGNVQLNAKKEGEFIRFEVRDTGVGIPEEDLARIFERFYKADRARASGGTGLGLSIARHLLEAHGGRIWAESREGEGSCFFFTLPLTPGKN